MPAPLQARAPPSPTARRLPDDVEAALGGQLLRAAPAPGRRRPAAGGSAMATISARHRHLEVELGAHGARSSARRRASWMWRRSSRRWTVMPSAPPRSAASAASTTSG